MSYGDIPVAHPFNWGDEEPRGLQSKNQEEVKPGAGYAHLQQRLLADNDEVSSYARSILHGLLQSNGVQLTEAVDEEPRLKKQKKLATIEKTWSDETILDLAQKGQVTMLGSLLRVIDDAEGSPVATRTLIKTCCLTVQPSSAPPLVDAKELILAALHFLSQEWSSSHLDIPSLPLIQPLQQVGDLEKRSYEKAGIWKLCDIISSVAELEDVFYSAVDNHKWMARDKFCPASVKPGRELLLLKGNAPAWATGKAKKATPASRRKKAVVEVKPVKDDDPVAAEATRIVSETNAMSTSQGVA